MRAVHARGLAQVPPAPPRALQRGKAELEAAKQRAADAAKRNRHLNVKHTHVAIRSSKLRFLRRLQLRFGGTRNIGMLKLVNGTGDDRKVVYVIARSMGIGKSKLTLEDEERTTTTGLKKRGHSEGVLRAVIEKRALKVGTKRISLNGWKASYVSSTNEACGPKQENCLTESVPLLTAPKMYFANPYTGSGDASGFESQNNQFQQRVRAELKKKVMDEEVLSEDESEDEAEVYVVSDEQLRGQDVADLAEIPASSFSDYWTAHPREQTTGKRAGVYGPDAKRT
jgi:hypothetical protein